MRVHVHLSSGLHFALDATSSQHENSGGPIAPAGQRQCAQGTPTSNRKHSKLRLCRQTSSALQNLLFCCTRIPCPTTKALPANHSLTAEQFLNVLLAAADPSAPPMMQLGPKWVRVPRPQFNCQGTGRICGRVRLRCFGVCGLPASLCVWMHACASTHACTSACVHEHSNRMCKCMHLLICEGASTPTFLPVGHHHSQLQEAGTNSRQQNLLCGTHVLITA